MLRLARSITLAVIVFTLVGLPAVPQLPLEPMTVAEHRVQLAFAAEEDGAWVATPIDQDATIVGLTWDDPADAPDEAEVRVQVDGRWLEWEHVEIDDEHSPDPESAEAGDARGGTAPIVVEGAEAIQFRVADDHPPASIAAEIVDVDDPSAHRRATPRGGTAEAAPTRPAINGRDVWGGDECVERDPEDIHYADRVQVLFVHHTASASSYTQDEVAGIVRGICRYHVSGRGWDDIGYNALIDAYGGIWEGRAGGIDRAVQGAHTGGFNGVSTGVAFIGDHHSGGAPTAAAQSALVTYAAWKLDVHNVSPTSVADVTSRGSSRWPSGQVVTLDAISGHRDASWTSCPGSACVPLLPSFRAAVDEIGGMRIFGGWSSQLHYVRNEDGSWPEQRFSFALSEPGAWTFELRGPSGTLLHRETGQSEAGVITWDGGFQGEQVGPGQYTTSLRATSTTTGLAATPSDHAYHLGHPGDFWDVDDENIFQASIAWLAESGITRGCNPPHNSRFCPSDVVTRGQMAAFLNRALPLPEGTPGRFRDVGPTTMFAADIEALAAAGITVGCNPPANDRFCPRDPVSRDQMAAFIVRAYGLTDADHPGFLDVPSSNALADSVRRLAAAGITMGCNPPSNTRFCPSDPVTREQMAAFLHRAS